MVLVLDLVLINMMMNIGIVGVGIGLSIGWYCWFGIKFSVVEFHNAIISVDLPLY